MPGVVAGQNYSGTIATNATDPNSGDVLAFAKVSGPAWLTVGTDGTLSGTPLSSVVGTNSFVVSVTDPGNLSNTATMNLAVLPAPPIVISITNSTAGIWMNWSGGIAPYQAQMATDLTANNWISIGGLISSNTFFIAPTNPAAFYRIVGQ